MPDRLPITVQDLFIINGKYMFVSSSRGKIIGFTRRMYSTDFFIHQFYLQLHVVCCIVDSEFPWHLLQLMFRSIVE